MIFQNTYWKNTIEVSGFKDPQLNFNWFLHFKFAENYGYVAIDDDGNVIDGGQLLTTNPQTNTKTVQYRSLKDIRYRAKTAQIPGRQIELLESHYKGTKVIYPGRYTPGSITVTFEESDDLLVTQTLDWIFNTYCFNLDHETNLNYRIGGRSVVGMVPNTMKFDLELYLVKNAGMVNEPIVIKNCIISNISDASLDYSGNEIVKYDVTFNYEYVIFGITNSYVSDNEPEYPSATPQAAAETPKVPEPTTPTDAAGPEPAPKYDTRKKVIGLEPVYEKTSFGQEASQDKVRVNYVQQVNGQYVTAGSEVITNKDNSELVSTWLNASKNNFSNSNSYGAYSGKFNGFDALSEGGFNLYVKDDKTGKIINTGEFISSDNTTNTELP